MFWDRREAAAQLANRLGKTYSGAESVVLAIPRGGIVIGDVVATELRAPLDVVVPRKLGAPGNPELGIGAVAEGEVSLFNEELIAQLGISPEYVENKKREQFEVVARRSDVYRGGQPPIPLEGKTAIIVDDGLATGFTAMAAVEAVRRRGASRVVLAVPVAPPSTLERFMRLVDDIVCLQQPSLFYAVGQFYSDFSQVDDDTVVEIIRGNREKVRAGDTTDRRDIA